MLPRSWSALVRVIGLFHLMSVHPLSELGPGLASTPLELLLQEARFHCFLPTGATRRRLWMSAGKSGMDLRIAAVDARERSKHECWLSARLVGWAIGA